MSTKDPTPKSRLPLYAAVGPQALRLGVRLLRRDVFGGRLRGRGAGEPGVAVPVLDGLVSEPAHGPPRETGTPVSPVAVVEVVRGRQNVPPTGGCGDGRKQVRSRKGFWEGAGEGRSNKGKGVETEVERREDTSKGRER